MYFWPGWLSCYSDSLRAGWSGYRVPLAARISTPFQTCPGAHPASYTVDTRSFQGLKRPGRGVDHPPASSSEVKERLDIYRYPLWGFVVCSGVTFTFTFYKYIIIIIIIGDRGSTVVKAPRYKS